MARRYIDQVMRAAVLEELRNGAQARELSKKYGIAESTLSRWRKQANIDAGPYASAVIRSKPLKTKEYSGKDSASFADQRTLNQKMQSLIDELIDEGGLKSSDIRNLASASKVLGEADARLEREEREEQAREAIQHASVPKSTSRQDQLENLVAVDKRGAPLFLDAHFAALDVEEARERGQEDKEGEAWARLCEILRSYGITKLTEADFAVMVNKTQTDFNEEMVRKLGKKNAERERAKAWAQTPWAQRSSEYNGEGRS